MARNTIDDLKAIAEWGTLDDALFSTYLDKASVQIDKLAEQVSIRYSDLTPDSTFAWSSTRTFTPYYPVTGQASGATGIVIQDNGESRMDVADVVRGGSNNDQPFQRGETLSQTVDGMTVTAVARFILGIQPDAEADLELYLAAHMLAMAVDPPLASFSHEQTQGRTVLPTDSNRAESLELSEHGRTYLRLLQQQQRPIAAA